MTAMNLNPGLGYRGTHKGFTTFELQYIYLKRLNPVMLQVRPVGRVNKSAFRSQRTISRRA